MDPRPSATPAPPTPIEASAPPFPDPQAASQQAIAQEHDAQSVDLMLHAGQRLLLGQMSLHDTQGFIPDWQFMKRQLCC